MSSETSKELETLKEEHKEIKKQAYEAQTAILEDKKSLEKEKEKARLVIADIGTAEKDITTNYRLKDPYKRNMSSAMLSFSTTLGSIQVGNIEKVSEKLGDHSRSKMLKLWALTGRELGENGVLTNLEDKGFFSFRPTGPIRVFLRTLAVIPQLAITEPLREIWQRKDLSIPTKLWNSFWTGLAGVVKTPFAWGSCVFNFLSTPFRSTHRFVVSLWNDEAYYQKTADEYAKTVDPNAQERVKQERTHKEQRIKEIREKKYRQLTDVEKEDLKEADKHDELIQNGYLDDSDAMAPGVNATKKILTKGGAAAVSLPLQLINILSTGVAKFIFDGAAFLLNNTSSLISNLLELPKVDSWKETKSRGLKVLDNLLRVLVPLSIIGGLTAASLLTGGIVPFSIMSASALSVAGAAVFSFWMVGFLAFLHQNFVARLVAPKMQGLAENLANEKIAAAEQNFQKKDTQSRRELDRLESVSHQIEAEIKRTESRSNLDISSSSSKRNNSQLTQDKDEDKGIDKGIEMTTFSADSNGDTVGPLPNFSQKPKSHQPTSNTEAKETPASSMVQTLAKNLTKTLHQDQDQDRTNQVQPHNPDPADQDKPTTPLSPQSTSI